MWSPSYWSHSIVIQQASVETLAVWRKINSKEVNFLIYSVSLKKGNQDSILNLSKSKRQIIKLLSVDDSIFIFLPYGTLVVHIGLGMAAQQSSLQSMSKLSSSKFCHSTQSSADALIVALLWKLPQMPSCSTNNANLDKTNFDMFYKIDCCAAIHVRI